ncbi:MAG: hypothetical protein LBV23_07385 [Deltaproteobacteria bacterium]|jgi:DNA-binding beta-propeller fold protein YncE|nr:hypothetical protein [Deltaproteobacteria bacterium]
MTLGKKTFSLYLAAILVAVFYSIGAQRISVAQLEPIGQLCDPRAGVKLRSEAIIDSHINSPKSINFSPDGKKIYINALEGLETLVYSFPKLELLKAIKHTFGPAEAGLFKNGETTLFDYQYYHQIPADKLNFFSGKPVEGIFSHNGRYFWVPYYRRDYDKNASDPSAMAIIDTTEDKIVRVMPTGPLPKMVAASPDGRYLAVTHWGDNTVGLIDVSSNEPMDFSYVAHLIDSPKLNTKNISGNRDNNCGRCLRGTVFTPDGHLLLVGRMAGQGVVVFSIPEGQRIGAFTSFSPTPRHLALDKVKGWLYASDSRRGVVVRVILAEVLKSLKNAGGGDVAGPKGQMVNVGTMPRTIALSSDGKRLFASVFRSSALVEVNTDSFTVRDSVEVSPHPVGLGLSPDGRYVAVTSQGALNKGAKPPSYSGGNSVEFFRLKD